MSIPIFYMMDRALFERSAILERTETAILALRVMLQLARVRQRTPAAASVESSREHARPESHRVACCLMLNLAFEMRFHYG